MSTIVSGIDVSWTDFKSRSYFKMISVLKEGGVLTTFSNRFSLTGMTGTTDPTFVTAAADAGDKVPEAVTPDAAPAADGAAGGDPDVPYASQTGLMRFAPMQSVPPTKITKKDTKPLYPTSSYKVATAFLPTPVPTKTQTASQTFSADSMENTVSLTTKAGLRQCMYTNVATGLTRARPCWRRAEILEPLEGLSFN